MSLRIILATSHISFISNSVDDSSVILLTISKVFELEISCFAFLFCLGLTNTMYDIFSWMTFLKCFFIVFTNVLILFVIFVKDVFEKLIEFARVHCIIFVFLKFTFNESSDFNFCKYCWLIFDFFSLVRGFLFNRRTTQIMV